MSDRDISFVFELSSDIPAPISVGRRNGDVVLILRDGAVVDDALVRILNDLTRPPPPEPPG